MKKKDRCNTFCKSKQTLASEIIADQKEENEKLRKKFKERAKLQEK